MSTAQATDPAHYWVAGKPASSDVTFAVHHPYDGHVVREIAIPSADDVERATAAAAEVFADVASLPAHVRATALAHVATRLGEERESIALTITAESGKPIRWARGEVARAIINFQTAAEEAKRFSGEVLRLDGDPIGEGRVGWVRRFPIGPVLGITPFNFPLNLVTHKVAPALAVGAPIVLKPAPQTPLTALRVAAFVAETDLPGGALSVLPLPNGAELDALVGDPRLPIVSFTGSQVGWQIKADHPRKHVLLELGGNAAAIVHRDADVDAAAASIAAGGFIQAGQTCIATQRVLVHEDVLDAFASSLVKATASLRAGDPFEDETFVGPLVSAAAADRVEASLRDALDAGAELLCGGERDGTTISPAVLAGVAPDLDVWQEEIFGPILALSTYSDVGDAFASVNASRFGLQAGVFTSDIELALRAHRELVVGAVMIGDSPSFRADALPYGGWKDSGLGREGIRAAMQELTDARALVLRGI
jgi:acyl-CoA reductase-like NAD-dependent aldehyde dehydrogenase